MADFIFYRILLLVPLWISLSVHEWAHARTAYMLGDDTAKLQGRMTLNPLEHIDPFGTFLLPLMGVPFGWAKPVPVEPLRFRNDMNMSVGMMITAIAGPVSNVILAVLCTIVGIIISRFIPVLKFDGAVMLLLERLVMINVILAIFNMLPIYPLDGSRVVEALIPKNFKVNWHKFIQIGPIILIAILIVPVLVLGYSPLSYLVIAIDKVLKILFA